MRASLSTHVMRTVQCHNPDWRQVLQPSFYPHLQAKRTTTILLLRAKAEQLFTLMASYRQPENFFEKYRIATIFAEFHLIYWGFYMPKRQVQQTSANERPEWKGFLERRLTEEELQNFDEQEFNPVEVLAALDDILAEGYKINLSYQMSGKTYTATLQDLRPTSKTAGYALSATDASGFGALTMLIYKHIELLSGEWGLLLGEGRPIRRG